MNVPAKINSTILREKYPEIKPVMFIFPLLIFHTLIQGPIVLK